MTGIQTRGRRRITTNKIEQAKTQNKVVVSQSGQSTIKYEPRPASGQLDQSTQNQIQPTSSNIEQAKIIESAKYKDMNEIERFVHGSANQVTDYQGIVNWDHKSESILNQSLEKVFDGDLEGAGKLIQDNPYRFAGNLAVEVGSVFIPATWGVKAVKYGAQIAKAGSKAKQAKKAQDALDALPTVTTKSDTKYTNVYAKKVGRETDFENIKLADGDQHVEFSHIIGQKDSFILKRFNLVKQVHPGHPPSNPLKVDHISIIPKSDDMTQVMFKKSEYPQGHFEPIILNKSEALSVLKGLRTEIKVNKRTQSRKGTLLKRNEHRELSMKGDENTSMWRRQILRNQIKEKLGFGAPVFRFAESPGAKAHVSILEQNTINLSKFSSGTTPEDAINTLVHESIHNALRAAGPGTLRSNKRYVETSRMQSSLDDISYMSDKSNQKKLVSTLNKENYSMDELKKMNPDKLDLLIREQEALGNTSKFSTGKTINWKKSNTPEIRRTSTHTGYSHLLGIDHMYQIQKVKDKNNPGKLVKKTDFSQLSPEANYKVVTSNSFSPLYKQFKYTLPVKKGKVSVSAYEIDNLNKMDSMVQSFSGSKNSVKQKTKTDWSGVVKDSALPIGIISSKGYQYYNHVKKNRYQKNKTNNQSLGRYGQFL